MQNILNRMMPDSIVGKGLDPQMCMNAFALFSVLRASFPEPDVMPTYHRDAIDPSDETFLKLLFSNAAMFLKLVPKCSTKQLLEGADSLAAVCAMHADVKQDYMLKGKTTAAIRMGRKVTIARLVTAEGLLPALAVAASHLAALLTQQYKQLQQQQASQGPGFKARTHYLKKLIKLGYGVLVVFSDLGWSWPGGKLFASKAFEPTWVPLSALGAAVLAAIKTAKPHVTTADLEHLRRAASQVFMCADVLAGAVIEGLSSSSSSSSVELPVPSSKTVQQFLLSDNLELLLCGNLAVAAMGRWTRMLGVSAVLAPPGLSGSDSIFVTGGQSSSSSGSGGFLTQQQQQQQQDQLHVPACHQNLLEVWGLESDDLTECIVAYHKDWEPDAIKSLYLIMKYRQQHGSSSSSSSSSTSEPGSSSSSDAAAAMFSTSSSRPQGTSVSTSNGEAGSSSSKQHQGSSSSSNGSNDAAATTSGSSSSGSSSSKCWTSQLLDYNGCIVNRGSNQPKPLDYKSSIQFQVLPVIIELIALDPDGQVHNIAMLLELADQQLAKLALVDEGAAQQQQQQLPVLAASLLMHPALQLLVPVVLHVLRKTAAHAPTALDASRGVMLFCARFITRLIGRGHLNTLAVNLYKSPLACTSVIDSFIRADACRTTPQQQQGQQQQDALSLPAAAAAAALQGQSYRVVLALTGALEGAFTPTGNPADHCEFFGVTVQQGRSALAVGGDLQLQQQLQQHLLSLLGTGLKTGAAVVAVAAAEQVPAAAAAQLSQVVNQAALTARLGCQLADLFAKQQQQQQQSIAVAKKARKSSGSSSSARTSSNSGSNATASGSSKHAASSSSSASVTTTPWMVLVSKSLLLLHASLTEAGEIWGRGVAGRNSSRGVVVGDSQEGAVYASRDYQDYVMSVYNVLKVMETSVGWLGEQLGQQAGALCAASDLEPASQTKGSEPPAAAAAAAREQVLQLQKEAAAAVLNCQAAAVAPPSADSDNDAFTDEDEDENQDEVGDEDDDDDDDDDDESWPAGVPALLPGALTNELWESCLRDVAAFASAACDQLPVSSCCNNTGCVNLEKPSEHQLVGGRGCVCAGCGVARYCSRACQQQHWKRHKAACKQMQK